MGRTSKMNTTLKRDLDIEKTRRDYRKVLWFYDIWGGLTESRALSKVLELADIRDNQKTLEVACGTGKLLKEIIRKNPNGYNLGIDLSPDMLRKAGNRFHREGLKNFELKEGNILDLGKLPVPFDLLVNNFMIDLLPENTFSRIAMEFNSLLKVKGIAVISTFSFGTRRIHKFWFRIAEYFPGLLTGCRPVSFKEYMVNAGFEIIDEYHISQNTFPVEILKAIKA
jgi:ubiquinone/menaquinone biosynthesis C-methylase UbiE